MAGQIFGIITLLVFLAFTIDFIYAWRKNKYRDSWIYLLITATAAIASAWSYTAKYILGITGLPKIISNRIVIGLYVVSALVLIVIEVKKKRGKDRSQR